MPIKLDHNNNFNLIRLIAALQVLLVHATNHFEYGGPYVSAVLRLVPGVPAFFFISGYLIFYSYERMHSKGNLSFFRNRVLRIYPGLWACVALATLSVYLTGYFSGRAIGATGFVAWILGQSTIIQFYNPDFMREYGVGVLNGALWTISVEVQFYILVPLIYLLIRNAPKIAALVLFASVAVNLILRENLNWDLAYFKLLYVSFVPWIYMFLLGSFAASTDRVSRVVDKIQLKYLVVAYILSMNLIGAYETNASNAINPISYLLLALLILKLATFPLGIPARLNQFIRKTDFSYALYLYHMPLINLLLVLGWFSSLANIFVLFVCSFMLASLSWYFVEKPALSRKR